MTRAQANIFEQFLVLFDAVKTAAHGEPSRVTTFYDQHHDLKAAVVQLYGFMMLGDFERRVFHAPKKYHPRAPRGFELAFKDYKKNWEGRLEDCIYPDLLDVLDLGEEDEGLEDVAPARPPILTKPDPDHEDRFDPLIHDGGKALPMAFWATESYAEGADEHGDTIHYASKIGLEAYDYLTGTIGLDVEIVFRRWRSIPMIFMPGHVSDAHGTERGSLYDLIDDAVRAYVFGAPAAATATCRAALEMVLKKHYALDHQYKDKEGRLRDKGLGELIVLADERYEFVQGKRLQWLSDGANQVMHNYSVRNRMSEADERTILDFLKTIKFLIERAPTE